MTDEEFRALAIARRERADSELREAGASASHAKQERGAEKVGNKEGKGSKGGKEGRDEKKKKKREKPLDPKDDPDFRR